jgi:VIT1/CCC1 family predicted Fe2+/Mn2+ transporter
MLNDSIKTGISFGLTSATITTLGLIMGLESSTHSATVVLGGILTIAIADAMSDALGIHISEESKNKDGGSGVWEATIATFASKFLFALTFAIPVILIPLESAIFVSIAWGLMVLGILSYTIAKINKEPPLSVIGEHIFIAILVITITHYLGAWIGANFV